MKNLVVDGILDVGVDEIDEDHRRLVDLFNQLKQSVVKGDAPDYQTALLEELINCTIWHFSHEERLMLKYGYDRIAEHETEHRALTDSALELQRKSFDAGKLVTDDHIEYLEAWLTEHILGSDRRLGSFLIGAM